MDINRAEHARNLMDMRNRSKNILSIAEILSKSNIIISGDRCSFISIYFDEKDSKEILDFTISLIQKRLKEINELIEVL